MPAKTGLGEKSANPEKEIILRKHRLLNCAWQASKGL
jgi:hypothetical protein